jgi:hypothetical protein
MLHVPGSLTMALADMLCKGGCPETDVCPLLDRENSREGSPEIGVCCKMRVVNGRSIQSGTVIDG